MVERIGFESFIFNMVKLKLPFNSQWRRQEGVYHTSLKTREKKDQSYKFQPKLEKIMT